MENGSYYYDKERKRWRILYTDPNTGKRKPIYGKTIEEVQTEHNKIKVALKNGTFIEKSKDSFNFIMDTHIKEQEANRELKPSSMNTKKRVAKLISQTEFAKKPIQKIDAEQIKKDLLKFANLKKPNGKVKYSQSYLDKIFSLTREVFNYAIDNDKLLLEQSPFKTKTKVKRPKSGKKTKKVTALNIEETKLFLKQLLNETDKYKDAYWVLLFTRNSPGRMSSSQI